jgi:hypothetical protein
LVGRALVSWTVVLEVAGAIVGWRGSLSVAWPIVLEPGAAVLEVAAHSHCEGEEGVEWMSSVLDQFCYWGDGRV